MASLLSCFLAAGAVADENEKAQSLAELLSGTSSVRQQALADEGNENTQRIDDLIRSRVAEAWVRPPSARGRMMVLLKVDMSLDGEVTAVSVAKSSGDAPFDASVVAAARNIGRLTDMQGMKPSDLAPYRSFKMTFTPEDLAL
ncbi:TonB family protein [Pseudomonas asplenii]|uniref:TonB family protein n=1 Tax=Pseudomonas asplenii TaxID=53407 RepID=UPI0037C6E60B